MKKRMTLLIATLLTATMLLSVVPVVNAADINETETQPTTVVQPDEPVDVQPTTINLKEKSKTLYIKGTYSINPNVVNAVGDTVFVSNNNSVAAVDNKGVVTAKKKGIATITVTNNGVVAQFKVVVKKPTVNLKKGKAKKVPVGTSFKLKITGKVGKTTYKVSNKKFKVNKNGELKAKKPGKATITIKTNGITIKRKIKSTLKLKITYKFKKKVKINVGQSKKIKKLYKYTANLKTLKKYVSTKKYKKYKKQVDKKAKSPKAKIKNTKVAKVVDNKVISGKKKGSTEAVVSCGKQSFNVDVDVAKLTETTFKGEKIKIAYSTKEVYNFYKNVSLNYALKGNRPSISERYIRVMYNGATAEKITDAIFDYQDKDYDNPDCFYSLAPQMSFGYGFRDKNCGSLSDKEEKSGEIYLDLCPYTDKVLSEYKKLYNAARDILNSINIDSFEEDYEKIVALNYWFSNNCRYGDCPYNGLLDAEKGIIYKHVGACTEHTLATNYFCALMKIPSVRTADFSGYWNHEWNFIKIGSKWYNVDNLNGVVLVGTDTLASLHQKHKIFGLEGKDFEPWKSRLSKTDISITKEKDNEIRIKIGLDPID